MESEGGDDYAYLLKVVLLGDVAVGKSNLLSRFCRDEFTPETKSTLGVDFATKTVTVEGKRIKALIWDTAGQERYRAICSSYYRGAVGALLVYDITSYESFSHLKDWLATLTSHASTNLVIILVGNKLDLEAERQVPVEEALRFADQHDLAFIETSAKDRTGVNEAFEQLLQAIHTVISANMMTDGAPSRVAASGRTVSIDQEGAGAGSGGGGGAGDSASGKKKKDDPCC